MLSYALQHVRERIQSACQRCGRLPSAVTLIGVTKGLPVERVREAIAAGLADLGENRVQEARAKQDALGSNLPPVRWHLIGHLQRNKVKEALRCFSMIHAVDSVPLVEGLQRHAVGRTTPLEVLVQVNVSGEATKFGCQPNDALSLAEAVLQSEQLTLAGLMTIAPLSADPERSRPYFRELRQLRDRLQEIVRNRPTGQSLGREPRDPRRGIPSECEGPANRPTPLFLSMGMSQDFEVAIEEGADFVRVGTALFGERHP